MISLKLTMPDLRAKAGELLDAEKHAAAAAGGVREAVKEHFDAKPGKKFYHEAAEATRVEGCGLRLSVNIYKTGVALRYFGGTVRPVNGKALAIPTAENPDPEKYPREYGSRLKLIPRQGKPALLFLPESNDDKLTKTGKLRRGATLGPGGKIMFTLVPKADHTANPTVLPPRPAMLAAARQAIKALTIDH